MESAKKLPKKGKEPTERARLNYIMIRLKELAEERAKLAEERKALSAKLRAERGKTAKKA